MYCTASLDTFHRCSLADLPGPHPLAVSECHTKHNGAECTVYCLPSTVCHTMVSCKGTQGSVHVQCLAHTMVFMVSHAVTNKSFIHVASAETGHSLTKTGRGNSASPVLIRNGHTKHQTWPHRTTLKRDDSAEAFPSMQLGAKLRR
jgi:hypothetical protein